MFLLMLLHRLSGYYLVLEVLRLLPAGAQVARALLEVGTPALQQQWWPRSLGGQRLLSPLLLPPLP
jgi:hypothetical protein